MRDLVQSHLFFFLNCSHFLSGLLRRPHYSAPDQLLQGEDRKLKLTCPNSPMSTSSTFQELLVHVHAIPLHM